MIATHRSRFRHILGAGVLRASALFVVLTPLSSSGADEDAAKIISVSTANSVFMLSIDEDRRVYQLHFGRTPRDLASFERALDRLDEFYPAYGNGYIGEPALQATHADGNTSTDLVYVKHETIPIDGNVSTTRIELRDPHYPFFVTIFLQTYRDEDMIEQWVEIHHGESGVVALDRYASASLLFRGREYLLSQFIGDYKREATLTGEQLGPGIKILDSKIGVRATRYRIPSFLVSRDLPAQEEQGEVVGGSLAWSGSFQQTFEIDHRNRLRVLSGINPSGSRYHLAPGEVFETPKMLWTWSDRGKGQISRNFHRWARKYGIRDGSRPRPVLLNNWEATHMNFDEAKIVSLFDGAAEIGVETFLLDDGWFGNRHPRDNDRAGLGDWQVNHRKLPHGLTYLVDEAKERGLGFGIWIEPEMVNPQSDLYNRHPDWAIHQPYRELELSRNQLVLDLSRPAVREHAQRVLDDTLGRNPGIGFVKWDANRYVTQPGSTYLKPEEQSHLLIDYNRALYDLMQHMATTYPTVMGMVCAGGGGRVDYGALAYFHSFWPSDNTDPRSRVFIQWGFSHFFPANTISSHVTRMGKRPLKFAIDVALSGALGVDMDLGKASAEERKALASAITLYRQRLREIVQQGDLYRLESPYEFPRAALMYVSPDRTRAVLFVYQLRNGDPQPVTLRGLDPAARYLVREVNLPSGAASQLKVHGQTVDAATLLQTGLTPPCRNQFESSVVEFSSAAE